MKIVVRTAVLVSLALAIAQLPARAEPAGLDPEAYPALTEKELGQVRRMVKLARQLPGDWSGMSDDLWAVAERTQQFQLSYMAMALALVQHQYTPAYRDYYRDAMFALVQKLTNPDIWESWLNSSRAGMAFADPSLGDMTRGWIDPIRKYNIMLKGYLLQAGAAYEMLYRDGRLNRPDSFTFRYQPFTWGNGPVTFRYSLSDIAAIVHQEYVDGDYQGVQCEPNRIFPACNQLPILGLLNHDQVYGTRYAADVIPKFTRAWIEGRYTNPHTGQNIRHLYVKQQLAEEPGTPVLDGWAGSWMHAWNPDLAQSIYPKQRELYLEAFLSGKYAMRAPPQGEAWGNRTLVSLGFGQFAFMAAELGDEAARKALLNYAERNFNPVWEDGTYYYPRNDEFRPDAEGNSHGVDTWTGNVLLALARLDKSGGFLAFYRNPWGERELSAPYIGGVDDLTVNVSRAWYDHKQSALVVTLLPGPVRAGRVRFAVHQLHRDKSYRVVRDGALLGRLPAGRDASGDVAWQDDGTVLVQAPFTGRHTFVIQEVQVTQ